MNRARSQRPTQRPPVWILIVGCTVGIFVLLFFMGLVIAAIFGYEVPPGSRFLVVVVLALGSAFSSGFLGGYASARGELMIPGLNTPLQVGFGGGLAVLVVLLILGNWLYIIPPATPGMEGWIRAGAVNNPPGIVQPNAQPGARLVERGEQPVTISPPRVPKRNDRVTITNDVNLRSDPPQSPDFNLQDRIGYLREEDKVRVIKINTYVDPNNDPTFTRVWAKVELLNN